METIKVNEPEIPQETRISFPIKFILLQLLAGLFGILLAVGAFSDSITEGMSYALGGLGFIFNAIRLLFKNRPQIILNIEGITTAKTSFKPWSEIYDEKVIKKDILFFIPTYFLSYHFTGGSESISINSLISAYKLNKLLEIYRERSGITLPEKNDLKRY